MRPNNRPNLLFILIALVAALSSGCASTAKISQFESFAVAGTRYAKAMDGLLTESTAELIDINSMKLLITADEVRQQAANVKKLSDDAKKSGKPEDLEAARRESADLEEAKEGLKEELASGDQPIKERLEVIRLLRPQVRLLSAYFSQLSALATTDAPTQFGDQLKNTGASLDELSGALKGSPVIGPKLADAAKGVGTLVVRGIQLKQLNSELDERKETIAEVMRIHRELLAVIADEIEAGREIRDAESYRTLVRGPLVSLTYKPAEWTAARRALLMPAAVIGHVESTRSALVNMENAWRKLLLNELTLADVQAVVGDLQPVLTALAQ